MQRLVVCVLLGSHVLCVCWPCDCRWVSPRHEQVNRMFPPQKSTKHREGGSSHLRGILVCADHVWRKYLNTPGSSKLQTHIIRLVTMFPSFRCLICMSTERSNAVRTEYWRCATRLLHAFPRSFVRLQASFYWSLYRVSRFRRSFSSWLELVL